MIPYRMNQMGIMAVERPIPLTLTAVTDATIELRANGTPPGASYLYCRYGMSGNWTSYTPGTVLPLSAGKILQWFCDNTSFSNYINNCLQFYISGQVRGRGDCMSLLKWGSTVPYYGLTRLFRGCSGLITAPEINTDRLSTGSFYQMFNGSGITTAPRIYATTLATNCLREAFKDCASLNRIEVDFTSWDEFNATIDWVSGVAASGTFIKPSALPEEYGANRIPTGWTVVNK